MIKMLLITAPLGVAERNASGVGLRYDIGVSMTGAPSTSSGTTPGVSLLAVIEAPRRLDELSTARVIGEAADAVHKAQKGGQPLGTLMPQAIVVAASGITLAPPAAPSISYTAPERLRGQAGDRRSDVFSLGVVLWEALAHERLFDAATDDARKAAVLEREIQPPSELNANVPAELDAICKKALDRDPANRYQSAKVMAAEISAVLDDAGYPDNHDEIVSYLAAAFPHGAPVAASTIGSSIAAKLASAPAAGSRQQLNQTMHGMAPIREPAATVEPATVEPAKPAKIDASKTMQVGSGLSLPELPKSELKLDPGKTIPVGSGISVSDLPKPETKPETTAKGGAKSGSKLDAKPAAKTVEPERNTNPSSGLSPMAFIKSGAPAPAPGLPSILAAAPSADGPARMPEPASPVTSTAPGTGIPVLAPAAVHAVHSATTAVSPPTPALLDAMSPTAAKPKATIVDAPKPKATIVDEPRPKATIASAETVATPALAPPPAQPGTAAAPSGVVGLPAMPPGASRSFEDDFATNSASPAYVETPVARAPLPAAAAAPAEKPIDPSSAVSLPRPRSATRPGADKGSGAADVLADWGWKTDSHAAIDDGGGYEEGPDPGRKRLIIAIGSALGAILLIVVIAVVASGGSDDKKKPKDEPAIADTSRTEPVAKAADPSPAPVPAEPTPAAPVDNTAVQRPPTGETPTPTGSGKVEPTAVEPARPDPALVDNAAIEANRREAARLDAEREKIAKAEEAKLAKAEASRTAAEKAETAKLAKTAKLEAARAEAAEVARANAEKVETAKLAKAAKAEEAKLARAEAARLKADKAEAAKLATSTEPPNSDPPKKDPVVKKDPPKKDPKVGKITGKPIDPYATDKAPKADPSVAYKTGFQQYVRGDTGGALTTFKGSLASNPGYPPTWRGLGLVYEKMGQKAQAKKSFLRYLQLSPNASDAEQIRTRMERLGS